MPVTKTAATAAQKLDFLAVVGYFAEIFTGFGVKDNGAAGHFYNHIVTVFTERPATGAAATVSGENVAAIAQGEQSPHIAVAFENDMSAAAAITTVGATFGNVFGTIEMTRTGATFARSAKDFNVVNKIGV